MRDVVIYGQRRFQEPPLVIWSDSSGVHDLDHRHDLQSHSVVFDWATGARGCLQLALAVLALVLEDDRAAMSAHGAFRVHVIEDLRRAGWLISSDQVWDWFKRWKAAAADLSLGYPYIPAGRDER